MVIWTRSVLPDGLEVEVCSPLSTADTPSLSLVGPAKAKAHCRSLSGNVEAAPPSGLDLLLLSFGFFLELGDPFRLDGLGLEVWFILDGAERRDTRRARTGGGWCRWHAGDGGVAATVMESRVELVISTRARGQ